MNVEPILIWYDPEWDTLEVFWNPERKPPYADETEHDGISAFMDNDGQVQGVMINGVSKLIGSSLETRQILNVQLKPRLEPELEKSGD